MKKQLLFSTLSFIFFGLGYSLNTTRDPLSLSSSVSKHLFTFKTAEEKEALNQKLISREILPEYLKFNGVTLEGLDLSRMHLRDIDFTGCIFKQVSFKDADLTGTKFDGATFDGVDLTGIIVYAPLGSDKKANLEKAFRMKHQWNHYDLLKQYSDRMLKVRAKNYDENNEEVKIWLEEAEGLNKFFGLLKLSLCSKDLKGFDLTNLSYAKLWNAHLHGAWLSEDVQVPLEYSDDNKTDFFKIWSDSSNPKEQLAYQKLFNFKFDMISGVNPDFVRKTLEKKVKLKINLSNAYLNNADLKGINLENANLQNANLHNAYLEGAHLENANLQNANLHNAYLEGAHLENANLQNANLWKTHLEEAHLENAQLQNAQLLNAHLDGVHLENTNLQNANLDNAHLQGAWLSEGVQVPLDYTQDNRTKVFEKWSDGNAKEIPEYQKLMNSKFNMIFGVDPDLVRKTLEDKVKLKVDLKNAFLCNVHLEGAHLKNARLQNASLSGVHLEGAHLEKAQLQNAGLYGARLQGTHLENANLQNANLRDANLEGVHLENANLQNANLYGIRLKGALLQGAQLSFHYIIPPYSKEEELIGFYHSCQDQEAKNLFKDILMGMEINIDN